jgi:hypothetical protein
MPTFHQQLNDMSIKSAFVCEDTPEMRPTATVLGAATLAAVLAACGSGHGPPARPVESEWAANAAGVIEQLRADAVAASDGDTVRSARAALRDESRLYGLVVAYTDFGGCRHMAGTIGETPAGFGVTATALADACVDLQRAAALFTRAAAHTDPRALVAAARAVRAAEPFLLRAALQLRRASR